MPDDHRLSVRFTHLQKDFAVPRFDLIEPDGDLIDFLTPDQIQAKFKRLVASGRYQNQICVFWETGELLACEIFKSGSNSVRELKWLNS